jgi:protein-S-isoprenylcysteine O-methyltransferase Ste14
MLPERVVAGSILIVWGIAMANWLVLWDRQTQRLMTQARRKEIETEAAAKPTKARHTAIGVLWTVLSYGTSLGLPLVFVVDGLTSRLGILYSSVLSFHSTFAIAVQVTGMMLMTAGLVMMLGIAPILSREVYAKATHERRLMTTGIYAFMRHPFYLNFLLLPAGMALITMNYLSLVLFVFFPPFKRPVFLPIDIRNEERRLLQTYGDQYAEYMKRTGRFLPRIRRRDSASGRAQSQ